MGREVRRVPSNWEHPVCEDGKYRPLLSGPYSKHLADWEEYAQVWAQGFQRDYATNGWRPKDVEYAATAFEDYYGVRPEPDEYMPEWPEEECTHYQMYEVCTEGTPISPVMASPEELARWLADNDASAFGSMTATYEQWLCVCLGAFAPSAIVSSNGLVSGVAALKENKRN
jgi:hypothetical protein